MNTWHVHIEGQVQGVGFRPFVYVLAQEFELNGWVHNTLDGVHIVFNAEENLATLFTKKLKTDAPRLSKITAISRNKIPHKFFDSFQIIHSKGEGAAKLLLTPDFGLCEQCRFELNLLDDRRYAYPFITCTNCGPRFSIINSLPYDRANTVMHDFQMCPTCNKEYYDPLDRRYYSQTNSCSDCGITLTLFDGNQQIISKKTESIIDQVVEYWEAGKIVAIKGIGGYLLTCDAKNEPTILELRKRKHRPSKPFALMYPDIASLEAFSIEENIIQNLTSPVSPIVLVELEESTDVIAEIAPGLNRLGVMLPYTPLYDLLLRKFKRPIVATSANISNSPIIFKDTKAINELAKIADYILVNNREIVMPQDDSVIQYSFFKKQKIVLRRSRGLAPTYLNKGLKLSNQRILAMGAMLKSTFTLVHQENTYISQYLGDLAHFDTQQNYQNSIRHLLNLFKIQPDIIIRDKHPEYASSQHAEQLAKEWTIPLKQIQHHIAHFGAIIGEHDLIDIQSPVLGVIWDGTGLGDDHQIWGGEFFKYEGYDFLRCYHFDYFDFILGDKMPKEPRISALSACWDVMGAENFLKEKFTKTEWQVYAKLLTKGNSLQTSSLGRVFDAVASLLGIMDKQSYEGEAAMKLEAVASHYFKEHGLEFSSSYFQEGAHYYRIPTKSLMSNIIMDLKKGKSQAFIAAKFHFSLVKLIKIVANNLKIEHIAFSGGVFQNSLLVDLIQHHLIEDFQLYFHKELSPNDENISFGQLVCYQIEKQKEIINNYKSNKHVFSDSR